MSINDALITAGIAEFHYLDSATSTNDIALRLTEEGCADWALVVADEQTGGRGRGNRRWFTPRGTALAFTLVLRPKPGESSLIPHAPILAALSVVEALSVIPTIQARIKWPNDILINRKKVCGILVEADWIGNETRSVVIGIGMNITTAAVPPDEPLNFPATSVEGEAGHSISRWSLLSEIIHHFHLLRPLAGTAELVDRYQNRMDFRDEIIQVTNGLEEPTIGTLLGIDINGALLLRKTNGEVIPVRVGDVHLRLYNGGST